MSLTVDEYAGAKRLPEEFLRQLGVQGDEWYGTQAVVLPYHDQDGGEHALRYRLALNGTPADRFRWPQGTRAKGLVYGLEEYGRAAAAGWALVVEGESDVQTARLHGVPAFGIPGASMFDDELTSPCLEGIGTLYVVQEPGEAGEQFVRALQDSRLRDRVRVVRLPEKDLSALHLTLDGDTELFQNAITRARSEASEPEHEEPKRGLHDGASFNLDFPCTDLGNAERFALEHTCRLRYIKQRRQWVHWDDGRWRQDITGEAERAAKNTVRLILQQAAQITDDDRRKKLATHALASQSDSRIRAMLSLAETEPGIVLGADELDRDPFLLACANGVVDLTTGQLRNPDPDDLVSLGTDVDYLPEAACPRWQSFLLEVFDGDADLIAYVQRFVGYSLSGDTREQKVAVLHGSGGNGKDTFLKPIQRVAGEHAFTASMDSFLRTRDKGVRNDLARLYRARVVVASESTEGRRLDEATIKAIAGSNKIVARFLYGEHFEFLPRFKVWLVTNHLPRVEGDDDAIWRRLRLIPFNVSFIGREDRELDSKLDAELPGILAWAVQGCLEWQRNGLGACNAVEHATGEYRADEDVLGTFLSEKCVCEGEVEPATFRTAYETYCRDRGEEPLTSSILGKRLKRKGITRAGRLNWYRGARLK